MPILSKDSNAEACTRHAMDIDFFLPEIHKDSHDRLEHFIFASQDLPIFCQGFLLRHADLLSRMELWIIIGDEVNIAGEKPAELSTSTHGKGAGSKTAAIKNAAAIGEGPTKNPGERDGATYEGSMEDGSTVANVIEEAESTLSEPPHLTDHPLLQRLLEPLLALHSIGYSYIDAPISESCRLKIRNSLSRARPSTHHDFSVASLAFDEAIATFDSRNFALAISKMRGTLDTLRDFCSQNIIYYELEVATGRNSGLVDQIAAVKGMTYILWNRFARANLEFPKELQHVLAARVFARLFINSCKRNLVWQSDTHAHERAMDHYLEVEVWEALDRLGWQTCRTRSDSLRDVVRMLKEALEHEPGNTMLEKKLQRMLKEMTEAQIIEEAIDDEAIDMEERGGEVLNRQHTG